MAKKSKANEGDKALHPFFIRKVIDTTNSRVIAMGSIIPDDWKYVKITIKKRKPNSLTLQLRPMEFVMKDAQTDEDNQGREQNT